MSEAAEKALYGELNAASSKVEPLMTDGNYTESLKSLAALKEPVDRFFDDVMVMADDESVRANRIALLSELRRLFLITTGYSNQFGIFGSLEGRYHRHAANVCGTDDAPSQYSFFHDASSFS